MAVGLGQAFTDALMASLGEGVYVVDLDGKVLFLNPAGAEMLGWEPSDLVGREMHAMVHAHGPDQPCPCRLAFAMGEPVRRDADTFVAHGGRAVPVGWTATPMITEHGIVGAVVAFRDVSDALAAERALKAEAQRNEVLLHVAGELAAELDVERLVQAVTDAGVMLTRANFGAFFYNVTDDAGESCTLYTLSGVPREAFAKFPLPRSTPVFAPTFNGERTVRFDDVTARPEYGTTPPHHGMPEGHLPVRSYLAVPVVSARAETIGGLFFGHSEVGIFTEDDARLVEGLAAQASVALDNARLFAQEQRLAETLQRSMLPRQLPVITGFTAATRYVPATTLAEVGGDWYDLVALPVGRVAAIIGDVAGHSLHAATVMAQIRNALRGYALDGHAPALVMERANRFISVAEPGEMVTCCYIEIDRTEGTATVVSAGHPPPVVMGSDGVPHLLEVAPGPPLGVDTTTRYFETTVLLDASTLLLLYTDGLIERRDLPIDAGFARLLAAVGAAGALAVDEFADAVLAIADGEAEQADDTALLVVAVEADPNADAGTIGRRLPPDRSSPSIARRFVDDVLHGWCLDGMSDAVQLLVSELVTNAVLHTATDMELRLTRSNDALRVEVADGSAERSVRIHRVEGDATSGRGLHLVESLADHWGVEVTGGGKTVWFEVGLPALTAA